MEKTLLEKSRIFEKRARKAGLSAKLIFSITYILLVLLISTHFVLIKHFFETIVIHGFCSFLGLSIILYFVKEGAKKKFNETNTEMENNNIVYSSRVISKYGD